ncbi:MAG TPA: glutamate--tRNA ligase, partial [Sphingobacteriaceae bacterium]
KFSIERVSKAGAKFDFDKARWFNAEWIKRTDNHVLGEELLKQYLENIKSEQLIVDLTHEDREKAATVAGLVKDRCVLLTDLWKQSSFFYEPPVTYDLDAVRPKWNDAKTEFFGALQSTFDNIASYTPAELESAFKALAEEKGLKTGELMLPFRIMLVGGKFGPQVFEIASILGKEATALRISAGLTAITA